MTKHYIIEYKEDLYTSRPYRTATRTEYLSMLLANQERIADGSLGVYLSRHVHTEGESKYFLYLHIDADNKEERKERIQTAIEKTRTVLNLLQDMQFMPHTYLLATGGTGFRILSPVLLSSDEYSAFAQFVQKELSCVDQNLLFDRCMPHQILTYKGSKSHSLNPVAHHARVIEASEILSGQFTPDDYLDRTAGYPYVLDVIQFMLEFFQFQPITDLEEWGALGEKIQMYMECSPGIGTVLPRTNGNTLLHIPTLSLQEISQNLKAKGIAHTIENRGRETISFKGHPCPACGKDTANAYMHLHSNHLYCFNTNCTAYTGIPLQDWAGITSETVSLSLPSLMGEFTQPEVSLEEAQKCIWEALRSDQDCFIKATPGSGKTHITFEYILPLLDDQVILYSCFNRDLKAQAERELLKMGANPQRIHVLHAREDTIAGVAVCHQSAEATRIAQKGYSPSILLCPSCSYSQTCLYMRGRNQIQTMDNKNGVYLTTHAMLPYLKTLFDRIDLLILDENLIPAFQLERTLGESDFRRLIQVLDEPRYSFIRDLLTAGQTIMEESLVTGINTVVVPGRSERQPNLLHYIAERFPSCTENERVQNIHGIVQQLEGMHQTGLREKEINQRTSQWLQGLIEHSPYSYLQVRKGEITYHLKELTRLELPAQRFIVLDGTGNTDIVNRILNRTLETREIPVTWKSRCVHIQRPTGRRVIKRLQPEELQNLLREMLNFITVHRILIVTYKFLKQQVLDLCRTLEPQKTFYAHHYFGPRGINDYKECEAMLAIGLPYENPHRSRLTAEFLYPHEKEDEFFRPWLEQNMQDDLLQTLHRIRPVWKEQVEIVIAAHRWPNGLPQPHVTLNSTTSSWKDLAIQRLSPWVKAFGFLNPDLGFLANVYRDTKENKATAFREKYDTGQQQWMPAHQEEIATLFRQESSNIFREVLPHSRNEFWKRRIHRASPITLTYDRWKRLLQHFQDESPYFETFSINHPLCGNQKVKGIGRKEDVLNFYQFLQKIHVLERFDPETYQAE